MPRIRSRDLLPSSIKPSALSQLSIVNTTATINGPYSVNNGGNLSFTSFISNQAHANFRIGSMPYAIVFLEDSLNTASIIGDTITGYTINGPFAMPVFTPYATSSGGSITLGGSDGNNLVYLTELINNTGSTHNIYVITDTRVYTPIGGSIE